MRREIIAFFRHIMTHKNYLGEKWSKHKDQKVQREKEMTYRE